MKQEKFGLIYDPSFVQIDYGAFHNLRGERFTAAWDLFQEIGLLDQENLNVFKPRNATMQELKLAHTFYYIKKVKRLSAIGKGKLSMDTPVFKGIYEKAILSVGGSLLALELILNKSVDHAMCLSSGFHHAFPDHGEGFCVFNDLIIASRILLKEGFKKILIVDIDSHFSNAVSYYFYDSPSVLVLSFHESPKSLYPRICGYKSEIGSGDGKGYTINVPFPERTPGDVFISTYDTLLPLVFEKFEPDFILFQCGPDGHSNDLVSHLNYSKEVYDHASRQLHDLAKRYSKDKVLLFAGGGYDNHSVAWNWALMISNFLGIHIDTRGFREEKFWDDNLKSKLIMKEVLDELISNINTFL